MPIHPACDQSWNDPFVFDQNIYSVAFGWISVKSICYNVKLKACVFLSFLFLNDLPIDESGVLESPNIIVLLLISLFVFVLVLALHYEVLLYECIYIYNCYIIFFDFPGDTTKPIRREAKDAYSRLPSFELSFPLPGITFQIIYLYPSPHQETTQMKTLLDAVFCELSCFLWHKVKS